MQQALLDKLDELTLNTKQGHPLPLGTAFLAQIQKARSERFVSSLEPELRRSLKLDSPDPTSLASFSMSDIKRSVAKVENSDDEFAVADIFDQMQAYYNVSSPSRMALIISEYLSCFAFFFSSARTDPSYLHSGRLHYLHQQCGISRDRELPSWTSP
jgi:hypothetical protein